MGQLEYEEWPTPREVRYQNIMRRYDMTLALLNQAVRCQNGIILLSSFKV